MADWGIKISSSGKNINSTTPEDYIFNSKYGSVKTVKEGSGSLVVDGSSSATATIAHDQNFVPMVMIFAELNPSSGRWYFGLTNLPSTATDYITTISTATYVSNSNIYLTITNRTVAQKTVNYYYFVFGDTAEY